MNPDARRALLDVYAELDAELAELQSSCRACGQCCDFSTHENVLYASRLEREVLSLAGAPDADAPEQVCPYLRADRCAARAFRTLGCRTHFCADEAAAKGQALYERYRNQIAEISGQHNMEWDYRPVLEWLRENQAQ
jgi:Fe-S-cluster containining protein